MEANIHIFNKDQIREVADKLVSFIRVRPIILNDAITISEVRGSLLKLKVFTMGMVKPRKTDSIESLKVVLNDWVRKRMLTNTALT